MNSGSTSRGIERVAGGGRYFHYTFTSVDAGLLFESQISFHHYIVIARSSTTHLYINKTNQIYIIVTVQKCVNEQNGFNFSRI